MKAEKKEKIYKAALSMIKKTGVHGLAMGQLSKDSGIAAGTFYHYFSSKEAMLQETYLFCHKRAAAVGSKVVKGESPYKNRFMDLVLAFHEHFSKNSADLYFMQESEAGFSVSNSSMREAMVFYNDVFHFFNQGVEKGTLRNLDPKLILQIIYQNIFATIKFGNAFESNFTKEELESILEISWHGLKSRDK